ncbi:hypothetical protein M011DRAFT_413623, partial [Sporormia fimetaria CBS 119925]
TLQLSLRTVLTYTIMEPPILLRQLLRAPASTRTLVHSHPRPQTSFSTHLSNSHQHRYLSIPRVITPSFWAALVPKFFRPGAISESITGPRKQRYNPATPFIVLSLLVGSQAIQTLWLKRDREHYMRRAEAKMGILREVIESVQKGEEVDVEKVLGTGDVVKEREWKEVLGEIKEEEVLFRSKKKRRALRAAELEREKELAKVEEEVEVREVEVRKEEVVEDDGKVKVETLNGARFY